MKSLSSIFALLVVALPISAAVIDFESIPGDGTPTEGLEISDQFLATEGIIFASDGGSPVIAEVGAPTTAFDSAFGPDTPAPGQGIGRFFLTDIGAVFGPRPIGPLTISYLTPTMAASGVLLDIDTQGFVDNYVIEARDISGNALETIAIVGGDTGTGDGIATPWSFSRPSADIWSIRISGNTVGFGLDLLDPRNAAAPIPEPSTWLLLGTGFAGFVYWRRKQAY